MLACSAARAFALSLLSEKNCSLGVDGPTPSVHEVLGAMFCERVVFSNCVFSCVIKKKKETEFLCLAKRHEHNAEVIPVKFHAIFLPELPEGPLGVWSPREEILTPT